MLDKPGLYVHLPWCIKKCPYCDFNSHPLKADSDRAGYLNALRRELAERVPKPIDFNSVFFGGGTPSLFAPEAFAQILADADIGKGVEVTMEANPGTTEHLDFGDYLAAGINRLSLGAQTFNNQHLQTLGRIHSANEIRQAYEDASLAGFDNINLDLMWGLPGQSVREALADLEVAISLGPEHLSWYQLTIEPKTEFGARPPLLPVEAHLAEMEREGLSLIADAGYDRYEVSAYTRGKRCLHNVNYWRFGDYVGLGAGAHGKETFGKETFGKEPVGKETHDKETTDSRITRTQNPHQPRVYLDNPNATQRTTVDDAQFEFMLNALRLKGGVGFEQYEQTTGLDRQTLEPCWSSLVQRELVVEDRIGTTDLGYRYLDSVVAEFLSP